ncbi:hypothetical protein [Pseudomonas sp. H2_A12]
MRTGIEQRQRRAVTTGQVQDDNAVPLQLALAHDYVQQLFSHGRYSMEFAKAAVAAVISQRMNRPPFTSQVAPVVK